MIIGIDTGAGGAPDGGDEAEHVAHTVADVLGLDPQQRAQVVVSTHVVRGDIGRDAVAVTMPDHLFGDDGTADLVSRTAAALPAGAGVVASRSGAEDAVTAGPDAAQATGWGAVAQAATRSAGRLVHDPGQDRMRGRMSVADLTAGGDIDEVRLIGSTGPVDPLTIVDTRGFVRPLWQRGMVVLVLQPAAGGMLTPFEIEDPPRCCEDHRPARI